MRRIRDFTNPIELLQVIKALAKAEVVIAWVNCVEHKKTIVVLGI